jgi:hypothetical protein
MPGGAKIGISQDIDWISTASGSERTLAKASLATARGTDSSPQSRFWRPWHIVNREIAYAPRAYRTCGEGRGSDLWGVWHQPFTETSLQLHRLFMTHLTGAEYHRRVMKDGNATTFDDSASIRKGISGRGIAGAGCNTGCDAPRRADASRHKARGAPK